MLLDDRQTLIIAIITLFLGKFLNKKFKFFREYNLPEPVVGGIAVSIFFFLLHTVFDYSVNFSTNTRSILLLIFFTTIGLSARFSTLREGGITLVILLAFASCYLFIQNFAGIGAATLMGLQPHIGLLSGSISMSGGHGTAAAFAPIFESEYSIENAMEIGIASATLGLIMGGLAGGPVARYLIKRHNLKSDVDGPITVGFQDEMEKTICADSTFKVMLATALAITMGIHMNDMLTFKMPLFVTCLFGGIIFTNIILPMINKKKRPLEKEASALALLSEVSLGLFLSMSLMSMQLWTLVDMALPILLIMALQVTFISAFAIFVLFRFIGKNYDAAVMCAGYVGLGLGATPTAMANMTAVTKKYGASYKAFIVIPLVGAFFIDISNAAIIQTLLLWLAS